MDNNYLITNNQGMNMTTLAELDKSMKDVRRMQSELSNRIGGDDWIICFYESYGSQRFGAWKRKDNDTDDLASVLALLSTDSIIERGAYTEEELQSVLDKVMELANE